MAGKEKVIELASDVMRDAYYRRPMSLWAIKRLVLLHLELITRTHHKYLRHTTMQIKFLTYNLFLRPPPVAGKGGDFKVGPRR